MVGGRSSYMEKQRLKKKNPSTLEMPVQRGGTATHYTKSKKNKNLAGDPGLSENAQHGPQHNQPYKVNTRQRGTQRELATFDRSRMEIFRGISGKPGTRPAAPRGGRPTACNGKGPRFPKSLEKGPTCGVRKKCIVFSLKKFGMPKAS